MPARVVPIERLDEPGVLPYAQVRDRDLARSDGLFVAEGEVVVRVLASQSRFRVRSLLLERRRAAAMADVIAALPDDAIAYVVDQPAMDAVVGFHIHRGILAVAERGEGASIYDVLSASGGASGGAERRTANVPVAVGLASLTNHDNVGGIFRNAAAFGARAVLLDHATCDPLYRKAIRVSVGAALVVPYARCESVHAMIDLVLAEGWQVLGLSARGDRSIRELVAEPALPQTPAPRGRLLLMGTEGDGLAPDVLERVTRVRIDMTNAIDSLNVAVASGIALYEVTAGQLGRGAGVTT